MLTFFINYDRFLGNSFWLDKKKNNNLQLKEKSQSNKETIVTELNEAKLFGCEIQSFKSNLSVKIKASFYIYTHLLITKFPIAKLIFVFNSFVSPPPPPTPQLLTYRANMHNAHCTNNTQRIYCMHTQYQFRVVNHIQHWTGSVPLFMRRARPASAGCWELRTPRWQDASLSYRNPGSTAPAPRIVSFTVKKNKCSDRSKEV